MGSLSSFYGLQKLEKNDSLSVNDYSFVNRNIDVIDRVMHKLEDALFSGSSPISDPSDPPTLEVSTSGGNIPAGRTVRYKITWVDGNGNETAASPEATVTTPAPIARPNQPSLALTSSGGSLLPGNYFYVMSAYVGANTQETPGSVTATLNVRTGTSNKITVSFPTLPAGADGFNIYRRGPGETQFYYLDTVDMDVATPPSSYEDDGSVAISSSRTPSATNQTYATNKVTITVPGATPSVPTGYSWKVYRSFSSGEWTSTLLEWVNTETYQSSGVIITFAEDVGNNTRMGMPPEQSSITGDVNRVSAVESDISAIEVILGTQPQGAYSDVAARLDGIQYDLDQVETTTSAENDYNTILLSDTTFTTTTLEQVSQINLPALDTNTGWSIDAYVVFNAATGENFKLCIQDLDESATPVSWGTLRYTIIPSSLSEADGAVYTRTSTPIVVGSTGVLGGIRITGSFIPTEQATPVPGSIVLSCAQGSSVATPVGSIIKAGSWIRIGKLG